MFENIVIKILANAAALWAAARYIPGINIAPLELFNLPFLPIDPLIQTYLAAAIALAIINVILYPILNVIAAVLPFITTAMLMVVLNMAILYAAAIFFPATLTLAALKPLLLSGLLLGIVNTLL